MRISVWATWAMLLAATFGLAPPAHAADRPMAVGLSPQDAQRAMTAAPGFRVSLFAGEPDIVQPIAFTIDARGRLWVVENLSYPNPSKAGVDRIVIFEDTDNDGRYDTKKLFIDKLHYASGIQLGFGGVYVSSIPHLLFFPDKDGDDKPDAAQPEVLLDGWAFSASHNILNDLTWGPDGWLYGCNGISGESRVGKPGTPEKERTRISCAVWRFHPTRRTFEIVCQGTTNPWGLDFNDFGHAFITNCVIAHLWQVIPGAHHQRMFGQDHNRYTYALMETMADHLHWVGSDWTKTRGAQADMLAVGGGHAHSGAMVYLGDAWPDKYRNTLFTVNLHGNRINNDLPERRGSGYVGKHGPDLLLANDRKFMGVALQTGPDGNAFLIDWYDGGECHTMKPELRNGRIFKISYGTTRPAATADVNKLADDELVRLQLHRNDFFVRQARRVLQERGPNPKVHAALRDMLETNPDVTRKLRALWALHVTGGADEALLTKLLGHADEHVRGWAVQLLAEPSQLAPATAARFAAMARSDASAHVRLALASAMQRLPAADRWDVLENLLAHDEDAADQNLPLMLWYALEPCVPAARERSLGLLNKTKLPRVREFIARRLVDVPLPKATATQPAVQPAEQADALVALVARLNDGSDAAMQTEVLRGMAAALEGNRRVPMPAGWDKAFAKFQKSETAAVRALAGKLAVTFGDTAAVDAVRKLAADASADTASRTRAIETLVAAGDNRVVGVLHGLLGDAALRGAALRGLPSFNDPKTSAAIVAAFVGFDATTKRDALNVLATRRAWAKELVAAVKAGKVAKADFSAFTVQQLRELREKDIDAWLAQEWGQARGTPQEKADEVKKYKALVGRADLSPADPSRGRAIFAKTCAQCHTLYGEGRTVGPDLTGASRDNLDYIFENIVDPSALIPKEYQMTTIWTKKDQIISGIVKTETDAAVTILTESEEVTVPRAEIDTLKKSEVSMMPEGVISALTEQQVVDLAAYLRTKQQVPMGKETK